MILAINNADSTVRMSSVHHCQLCRWTAKKVSKAEFWCFRVLMMPSRTAVLLNRVRRRTSAAMLNMASVMMRTKTCWDKSLGNWICLFYVFVSWWLGLIFSMDVDVHKPMLVVFFLVIFCLQRLEGFEIQNFMANQLHADFGACFMRLFYLSCRKRGWNVIWTPWLSTLFLGAMLVPGALGSRDRFSFMLISIRLLNPKHGHHLQTRLKHAEGGASDPPPKRLRMSQPPEQQQAGGRYILGILRWFGLAISLRFPNCHTSWLNTSSRMSAYECSLWYLPVVSVVLHKKMAGVSK